MSHRCLAACLIVLLAPWAVWAQIDEFDIGGEQLVSAAVQPRVSHAFRDQTFKIAVMLDIEKGWHIGWRYPGLIGLPTTVNVQLPLGIELIVQRWSLPRYLGSGGMNTQWGYEERAGVEFTLRAGPQFKGAGELVAEVDFLVCAESCLRGKVLASGAIKLAEPGATINSLDAPEDLVFEHALVDMDDKVTVQDKGATLELKFLGLGQSQVEVFCAPQTLTDFSFSVGPSGLLVQLVKGPAFTAGADVLVVVRPKVGSPIGVRL